jgi:hypothetical protein
VNRETLLQTALQTINGPRQQDYGDVKQSFNRIACGWDMIAKAAIASHGQITAAHVALMMDWLKTSRLLTTMDQPDSWVDKVGYIALGSELKTGDSHG